MQLRLLSRFLSQEIDIPGDRLYLRHPNNSDYAQWVKLRSESSEFLKRWEPKWPNDDLSRIGFRRRLKAYAQQRQSGWGRTYFLFEREGDQLLGGIGLTRITHGISNTATLGYWMGAPHAGKGHMRITVPALLDFAFENLNLNRIEAACLPRNQRSINLLLKCGFREEGYAREYLEINGTREDHILFAALRSERTSTPRKILF